MSRTNIFRVLILTLIVGVFVLACTAYDVEQSFHEARSWFQSLGWTGPVLFALIYGSLGAMAAPTGLVEIIAGAIFGFLVGSAAVLCGALLAANLGFVSGRWLARDWIAKRVDGNRKAEQIETAVAQRGFWITTLIRLSPAVPFNLTSYVLGASRIGWPTFLVASLLGMLPIKLLLVWIGANGHKLLTATRPSEWGPQEWVLYGGGTLATLVVVGLIAWIVNKSTRQILQEAQAEAST